MPGPRNSKKKNKIQTKKEKRGKAKQPAQPVQPPDSPASLYSSHSHRELLPAPLDSPAQPTPPSEDIYTPSPDIVPVFIKDRHQARPPSAADDGYADSLARMQQYLDSMSDDDDDEVYDLLKSPCVEDLGDGPRVRDVKVFLNSKVAAPVSLDDPLCAEFAQLEVLEMLCCVLPEETAMIAWYNLSRWRSRVCPACKRLYHIGDRSRDPFSNRDEDDSDGDDEISEQRELGGHEESQKLHDEQLISGICSALCYLLVAHNYPGAIRSTFGRRAEDISDEAWDELNGPGSGAEDKMGLSMLLKMTRCHDMGLEQLIFPGVPKAITIPPHGNVEQSGEGNSLNSDSDLEGEPIPLE